MSPPFERGGAGGRPWTRTLEAWSDSPLRQLGTASVVATVIALLSASQLYVNWTLQGFEAGYGGLLASELTEWLLWAAAVPAILALDRRAGFAAGRAGRALTVHLAAALAFFAFQNAVLTGLTLVVDETAMGGYADLYLQRAILKIPSALAVYGAILGIDGVIRMVARQQRLRRRLLEAQLQDLRAQIQPHFLFNALHTVGSLVRSGRDADAVDTLVALSDLLRRSLRHRGVDEVTLGEEAELARAYLSIQRNRFGDRLEADLDIPPSTEDVLVPVFLLQPLLENSIRHGLDLDGGRGLVAVSARVTGDTLRLHVRDSGRAGTGDQGGLGIGLQNVRARLAGLYGSHQELRMERIPGGGTQVRIDLPARREVSRGP